MKRTKPDRWERMVDKYSMPGGVVASGKVAALLRKEHAAVVRVVRDLRKYYTKLCGSKACTHKVKAEACAMVLYQLTRMAK